MAKKNASTRNEAAAKARAAAQAQVRAQERRTTVLIVALSLIGVGLFVGIVLFIVNQAPSDGAVVEVADDSYGIPVGTDGVVGGDVPSDAIRVDIYADYMCGFCARFEATIGPDVDAMREEGLIELYVHPIAILDRSSSGSSHMSAAAAAAVADLAPEYFVEFNEAILANQSLDTPWNGQRLSDLAGSIGVPNDVLTEIRAGSYLSWVRDATRQSSVDGVRATPSIMVDGEILNIEEVPYMDLGYLREFIETGSVTLPEQPAGPAPAPESEPETEEE